MKKKEKVYITIAILIIVIFIGIIINDSNNTINRDKYNTTKQLGLTTDNAYVGMQKHLSEVKEEEQKLVSFKSVIANAITEVGVETAVNADATTMASNIRSISGTSIAKIEDDILKSQYYSIVRVGTDIGSVMTGYGCSLVKLNMDKIKSITINKINVVNTYVTNYCVSLMDRRPTSYNDVYNNAMGSYVDGATIGDNWVSKPANITIDCTNLTGYKYLATAFNTNNSRYTNASVQITSMTIEFVE